MKKVVVNIIMMSFLIDGMYASSAPAAPVAATSVSNLAQAAVVSAAPSSLATLYQLVASNPHIVIGLALFMSRPVLGLVTQAENYSLARLAGLSVTSNSNNMKATVNVGPLALQAITLTNDQVQEHGILNLNLAVQEVQDPATFGSAYAISAKAAKKDIPASQPAAQNSQESLVDAVVNQVVEEGLQDVLAGNQSNPALVQGIQDTIEGDAVWGLNVSANIGNYGLQGTVALSDVVLAILGALAVLGLQATGSVVATPAVPAL